MSGGMVVVVLSIFERFSAKNVPLWVYGSTVMLLIVIACYLAWRDERGKTLIQAQRQAEALPELEVEITEAILQPIAHNSLRCFIRVTVRNLTEDAPCMIHNCVLGIRTGENWHRGGILISANAFQLITCAQFDNPDEIPLNQPYHFEDRLPVIETAREDITDLRSIIGEEHPLKRGFPKNGWIGFHLKNLPNWPTHLEDTGGGELEFDPETGEEKWVEQTTLVRTTNTIDEISLEVIDGHGEHHSVTKLPPFGSWERRIAEHK